jgi:hypothetical protein
MQTTPSFTEIPVPGKHLCGLTWQDPLLWVSDAQLEEILAIDSRSGEIVRRVECPAVVTGLTHFNGELLQVAGSDRSLRLMDSRTGEILEEFLNPRPGLQLCGIEATPAGVWLGYEDPPMLELRRFPYLELADRIAVHEPPAGVTMTDKYIAYANYPNAHIHLVDREKRRVAKTIKVQGNPTGLTWDGRRLWYCDHTNLVLRAVDISE